MFIDGNNNNVFLLSCHSQWKNFSQICYFFILPIDVSFDRVQKITFDVKQSFVLGVKYPWQDFYDYNEKKIKSQI